MMAFRSLADVDLADRRVVTRLDLNLPIQEGIVSDWTRLDRSESTLRHIVERGGQAIVLSHLGRPDGAYSENFSFRQFVGNISNRLGMSCELLEHRGQLPLPNLHLQQEIADILLVDNTRFFPGEVTNDTQLAEAFANLGDLFCLDAFSVAHRSHASVSKIASLLPSCAGLSLSTELSELENALGTVKRPALAIVGGAKVSTKIGVLTNLIPKMDAIVVGGGMANTLLKAKGYQVGKSLVEDDQLLQAEKIRIQAEKAGCRLILPIDVATNNSFAASDEAAICDIENVAKDQMILDFGPQSAELIKSELHRSKAVVWNGPLGAFELKPFDASSADIAKTVAGLCKSGELLGVAGGGDTLALLSQVGVADDISFCSTGGGAFLEWLEGKDLPGLVALETGE